MKPTFKNLKRVVRKSYEPEPYARYIVRHLSILFTWIFVRTPISANQVTILQEVLGVTGVVLLAFGKINLSLLGVAMLQLGYILDCSDGEVARWKNQKSINGVFLDLVGHLIIIPGYMFGLGFGVWMQTGRIEAIIAGFLAALFGLRLERHTLLSIVDSLVTEADNPQYDFKHLKEKIVKLSDSSDMGSAGSIGRRSLIQVFFRYPDSMNVITVVIILDFLIDTYKTGGISYPISYFLILIYGSVLFFGRLWQIRKVFKRGLVELRYLQILKIAREIFKES